MKRSRRTALVLVTSVMLLAGCGEDSGRSPLQAPVDAGQRATEQLQNTPSDTCAANPTNPACAAD